MGVKSATSVSLPLPFDQAEWDRILADALENVHDDLVTLNYTVKEVSANYTMHRTERYIAVDTTGGAVTVILAKVGQVGEGVMVIIKDAGGGAGANNIIIDPDGTEEIDNLGAGNTETISVNDDARRLFCTGTKWHLM